MTDAIELSLKLGRLSLDFAGPLMNAAAEEEEEEEEDALAFSSLEGERFENERCDRRVEEEGESFVGLERDHHALPVFKGGRADDMGV